MGRFAANALSPGNADTFSLSIDLASLPNAPPMPALSAEAWSSRARFRDGNPGPTSNFSEAVSVSLR